MSSTDKPLQASIALAMGHLSKAENVDPDLAKALYEVLGILIDMKARVSTLEGCVSAYVRQHVPEAVGLKTTWTVINGSIQPTTGDPAPFVTGGL